MTFLLRMLPPAIMAVACSKFATRQSDTSDGLKGTGTVTIDLGAKSIMHPIRECLVFAMDEDGKVIQKDSIRCPGGVAEDTDWKMAAGTYRIWCVVNGGSSSEKALWSCGTEKEISDVAFALEDLGRDRMLSLLTVNGNDETFTLESGETKNILLTGRPLTAKIRLRNIVNKTCWNTLPAYGPVSVSCKEAYLLNIADSTTICGEDAFPLKNSTVSKVLDLTCDCVHTDGSGQSVPPGETHEEDLVLYCFQNQEYKADLILAVAVEIASEYVKWYNIPIGKVKSGYEYTVSNLIIMKDGAPTPFILSPTGDFCWEASAQEWEPSSEVGLEPVAGAGEMEYVLSHATVSMSSPPEKWSLNFNKVYGPSRVISSHPERVYAGGAGKYWILTALSEGYAALSLYDGLNEKQIQVYVEP